ncbi:MAG TPA: nitroreductase family protein [Acidimicrobiia bacterium]|nr:nitroreductase family protein [Acidimicrobiia bacterium]
MTANYEFVLGLRAIRDYEPQPLSSEDLRSILEAGRRTGSSKNRQSWSFIALTDPKRIRGLAEHGDFTQPVRDSAATIVLVEEPGGNEFDIGRAAQNMMLAAKAIGVASCPITLHRARDAAAFLGVPEEATARYAIALGYPSPHAKPANFGGRKPTAEVVKIDHY